jgi:hypothetical protein
VELEAIVRQQAIDFPATGPLTVTAAQKARPEKAIEDAVAQEDRYEQIVRTTRATTGGIVAVENLNKGGQPDSLTWLGG